MVTREEALQRLRRHIKSANLVKHMVAVSVIMRGLGERLGEDPLLWEAVGLLHDIDYEEVGDDWDRHGLISAELVSDALPERGLHAIKAHNSRTGVEVESRMDTALIAADALSGLIVATALMMPEKKLAQVKVGSLRRKFNDSSFARGVSRENLVSCEKLGMSLDDFFTLGLKAMLGVSDELGL